MGRIFWKVLLIVLFSNAVVLLATFVVGDLLRENHPDMKKRISETYHIAREAVSLYENGQRKELRKYRRGLAKRRGVSLYLLDEVMEPLDGSQPQKLLKQVEKFPSFIQPHESENGRNAIHAVPVISENDIRYHVLVRYKPGARFRSPAGHPDLRLVLLVLAIVISSAVIAWLFNRPLRKLKSVTREFAEGGMDSRVPESVTKRRDVIGELGSEFNHMAGKIEQLLASHKRLLRDISHELRTPLARMQVALSLLEQRSQTAPGKEQQRIQIEIEKLDFLIGQIITLSRLDSGEQHLSVSAFNLTDLINKLLLDIRFEHSETSKKISYEGPETLSVQGDDTRIQSALENVLRNAMNYTRENTVVRVTASVSDEKFCTITVKDNGPGVPPAELGKIFDAFYRAQEARDESTGGTGIGLAISRRVIELHGGEIHASNRTSGGLNITITIPLRVNDR